RSTRDWSSDVCSSDLLRDQRPAVHFDGVRRLESRASFDDVDAELAELLRIVVMLDGVPRRTHRLHHRARRDLRLDRLEAERLREIGRASWRETRSMAA